jgi:hypothetical protein
MQRQRRAIADKEQACAARCAAVMRDMPDAALYAAQIFDFDAAPPRRRGRVKIQHAHSSDDATISRRWRQTPRLIDYGRCH